MCMYLITSSHVSVNFRLIKLSIFQTLSKQNIQADLWNVMVLLFSSKVILSPKGQITYLNLIEIWLEYLEDVPVSRGLL